MKTSAGIVSFEIYNQEGKNELFISKEEGYNQLLRLKIRNSSPYHNISLDIDKAPHFSLKFKKGLLPSGFNEKNIRITKYRLVQGSDLFSASALEGFLFDKSKMEKEENFQMDIQKILDAIDESQATRSADSPDEVFSIDSLLSKFNHLSEAEKQSENYNWLKELNQLHQDYIESLKTLRKLSANKVVKTNPLFMDIIQEATVTFEGLAKLQNKTLEIERNLELFAQEIYLSKRNDLKALDEQFHSNYKKATSHLITVLSQNLKDIIVEALSGIKVKDITNLDQLNLNEDVLKRLQENVFMQEANADWQTQIGTSGSEEEVIQMTCKQPITLHPNEYLLINFELIGTLKGQVISVVTELDYSNLVFKKNGVEDASIKEKHSQSILNIVNDGAFGIPPNLELLVSKGQDILNSGAYSNTIKLNLVNKERDNIVLSEGSTLRLSFYNQQENEEAAYALQGKDDEIKSISLKMPYLPKGYNQIETTDIFKLVKNQNSLTQEQKKGLIQNVDKNLLIQNTHQKIQQEILLHISDFFNKITGRNAYESQEANCFGYPYKKMVNGVNTDNLIFKRHFQEGDILYYDLFYKKEHTPKKPLFNSSCKYAGRIKVFLKSYLGKDSYLDFGIVDIVNADALCNFFDSSFKKVTLDQNYDDLKDFLLKNSKIILEELGIESKNLTSIGHTFQDFDAVFYEKYTSQVKGNKRKIQYLKVIGVKKINSSIIEIYEPYQFFNGQGSVRDLETYGFNRGGNIRRYLHKTPVVTESMELASVFYLRQNNLSVLLKKERGALNINLGAAGDELILSSLPSFETFQRHFTLQGASNLSKIGSTSAIQTTYEIKSSLPIVITPNTPLELTLDGVKTSLPVGKAVLKVSLLNISNYRDAHLSTAVNRVSYLNEKNKSEIKGIYTDGTSNDNISILHDVVNINGLSIKKESDAKTILSRKELSLEGSDEVNLKSKNYSLEVDNDSVKIKKGGKTVFEVSDLMYKVLPVRAIIMWHGSPRDVPKGWAICDGRKITVNGKQETSPDLRSRFIVGASEKGGPNGLSKYGLKDNKGGVEKVKLTKKQMPSHSHSIKINNKNIEKNTNWGNLQLMAPDTYLRGFDGGGKTGYDRKSNNKVWRLKEAINLVHNHTATIGSDGGNESHENRPPFYALYYIMRVD
jgi:microcystin-dependent protein